ncbi:MAG: branched-chain amino acid ABC transporter permease [Deltaproteobacteria bacterium]|nr:branched-chain amino acid ABC transporter permease [Deltaproteobacteria bacterium]
MISSNGKAGHGFMGTLYRKTGLSGPVALIFCVGFILVPLLPGEFPVIVAVEILILGLFAMSFNLIYGYMGQISFGHAAFFGIGAYGTALVMRTLMSGAGELGIFGFFMSLLVAVPVAAIASLVVGFFCIRLTGIYFAILSLAFGELLFYVVFSWYSFTGGDNGIQGLMPPPYFRDSVHYYYLTLFIVYVALAVLWHITRSPFGYTLRLLRDNQQRASFLGINVRRCMLMNFVIAGSFAGIAGALWCPFQRSVSPVLLGWGQSGLAVFMTLIGGAEFFAGPMAGSMVYTFLNAYVTRYTIYWPLTIGLIILFLVLFVPGGLLSLIDHKIRTLQMRDRQTQNSSNGKAPIDPRSRT